MFVEYVIWGLRSTRLQKQQRYSQYPLIVKEDAPFSRTEMQIFLEKRNIQTRVVFTGNILRQPGYRNIDCIGKADDFINADRIMLGGILLACHHGLNGQMLDHLYESCSLFLEAFTRS